MTTERCAPGVEHALRLFREYFFSRTDVVAFLGPWNKPHPGEGGEYLDGLLTAHLLGQQAPEAKLRYRKKDGATVATSGRFRIGSYTPAPGNKTKWLCIDFDGHGHAGALQDPEAVARRTQDILAAKGIPSHLERSGGGKGWHLWVFFTEPVPAAKARWLALELVPRDAPLATEGLADPRKARGIEVFPKQSKIKSKGYGNLVWLPWWSGAKEGGNLFYRPRETGSLEPYVPEGFKTVDEALLDQVLAGLPEADEGPEEFPETSEDFKGRWSEWRKQALAALPLESVYGEWLTGKQSGDGWLECRDPSSSTGDRNPSAGVADGSNGLERGAFHSFISGQTMSLFDFMIERGLAQDFRLALDRVAQMSGVPPPSVSTHHSAGGNKLTRASLPEIQVNNRQLREIIADAWRVVRRANVTGEYIGNRKPFLFLRGGSMVRLVNGIDGPMIQQMDEASTYGLLTRVADWVRITDEVCADVMPVKDVARDMLAYPSGNLPLLDTVVSTPVFGRDGEVISSPGYHAKDRLWFHPTESLRGPDVPERPTREDIEAAKSLLFDDLLVDFPFICESDRAHAVAALMLPFVRRLIEGCTPLHLIEAPTAGSGKGLLSNLLSIIATGRVADGRTMASQDDEARKMFTAELMKGRPIVLLDNLTDRRELSSPTLASVLTAESWTDRLLGQTTMVTIPNRALWLLTANNPRLSMEIARRCVRIRIDPRIDRPWQRSGFKHMEIVEWAKENRSRLVHAVLVLVRAWIAAGRPMHKTRLGSFEQWSGVVGGILDVAGVKGFLGSLEELYEMADAEGQRWREFTATWWEAFKDEPKKVSELNELCEQLELMLPVRGDGTGKSQQTRLGKALLSARDRIFDGLRIDKVNINSRKQGRAFYRLVHIEDELAEETNLTSNQEVTRQDLGVTQGVPPGVTHDCHENINGCEDGGHGGHLFPDPRACAHAHTHACTRTHVRSRDEVSPVSPGHVTPCDEKGKVGDTSFLQVSPRCHQVSPQNECEIDLASIHDAWDEDD
jgi:hypothetical protein